MRTLGELAALLRRLRAGHKRNRTGEEKNRMPS
jgi:hypothetical protein